MVEATGRGGCSTCLCDTARAAHTPRPARSWAGPRNASGYLTPEADHFPNGMKTVVDYAHSHGLSFGLYTCAGTETCVGGRPGSKDHWPQDAAVWAEWGVDWMKMDWCNTAGMVSWVGEDAARGSMPRAA